MSDDVAAAAAAPPGEAAQQERTASPATPPPAPSSSADSSASSSSSSSFKGAVARLVALAWPERHKFGLALGALVVTSASNLLLPALLGHAVDRVSGGDDDRSVASSSTSLIARVRSLSDKQFFAGCLGVFACGSLGSWFRTYTLGSITENIAASLRSSIYGSVLQRDLGELQINAAGADTNANTADDGPRPQLSTQAIVQALSVEADLLASAITKQFTNLLRGCSSTFGGAALLLSISPKLTGAALLIVPVVGTTAMVSRLSTRKRAKAVAAQLALVNGRADERLKNLRTVKVFGREQYEAERYAELVGQINTLRTNVALSEGVFMGTLNFTLQSSLLCVLCFGGLLVKRGELTGGKLTAFMGYTMWLGLGSSSLASIRAKTVSTVAASENIFRILDAAERDQRQRAAANDGASDRDGTKAVDEQPLHLRAKHHRAVVALHGDIVFEGVHFAYGQGGEEPAALRGLNLTVRGQSQTAIVGPSGAGKSSVVSLLLRLYEPGSGRITIGGVDVRNMPVATLRAAIGVVDQRPVLWNLSIRENIRYGKLDATAAEVEQAARDAFVDEFADKLPNGLESICGESGDSRLSGGQLARIAIARSILKDPPILVLDEATAALDAVSEAHVRRAIHRLMEGRTTLIIAHTLDAIQDSDFVAVLEQGSITEQGELGELKGRSESLLRKFAN